MQERVLRDLSTRGLAFARYDELGVSSSDWTRLRAIVDSFAASERVREAIRRFPEEFARREMRGDDYMVKLLPKNVTLPADHPLVTIGLSSAVLDVVNRYLDLWAKLIYTDVWHTIPFDPGRRIGSQDWHRDPEDSTLVKVYMYFSNVDATAGPLEYIPGSAPGGPHAEVWPWKPRGERYPPAAELEQLLGDVERVSCLGTPGTVILCDTGGFHRGGIATEKPRIAATWTFVRPASAKVTSERRFTVESSVDHTSLSPAARFALS